MEAIHSLKYGIVSIIVQDGHVIQIEKLEKERLK
ncbi:YezD family protein [Syntrophothermus sp.]|nr:YezD family protein [Syntrophothermus sp.]